jgi:hypothetical protein
MSKDFLNGDADRAIAEMFAREKGLVPEDVTLADLQKDRESAASARRETKSTIRSDIQRWLRPNR